MKFSANASLKLKKSHPSYCFLTTLKQKQGCRPRSIRLKPSHNEFDRAHLHR
ncbi:hypothetical protein QWZ13_15225 [Reinekea marina]|uniref:hypothetical protein n=1 Tax=Reinekea marina TaxID=1310421 RepID=UPI0025B2A28B|nr:hypothetical protein [Reinekea marina]MDN3650266.1 hypothetical protein [Reinekea marina]